MTLHGQWFPGLGKGQGSCIRLVLPYSNLCIRVMYTWPDFPRDLRPRKQQLKLFWFKMLLFPQIIF